MKKVLYTLNTQSYIGKIILVAAFVFPFTILLINLMSGSSAFWYDPARDLSEGIKNLSKLTLIGPTSGIPGIFYGPYWIWLLSFGLLFSKDPRIVTFVIATIPYFTLFPYILFQFRKLFGTKNIILLWLFFIFSFSGYAIQLWNPYVAPLLFLIVIYLVTFTDFNQKKPATYLKTLLLGMITALALNFHISFGLGLSIGVVIYLFIELAILFIKDKNDWINYVLQRFLIMFIFMIGFIIIFLPFFAFEYRHGFQQIQTAVKTITAPGAVVTQKGITDIEILQNFFGRLSQAFYLPLTISTLLGAAAFLYVFYYLISNRFDVRKSEIKLFLFLITVSICVLTLYLTSKNPVWNYHFITVEIIFLFVIALFIKKFPLFQKIFILAVGIVILFNTLSFIKSFSEDPKKVSTLYTKEYIVNTIIADAGKDTYTVYPYNASIYNYDYAYLFTMRGKELPYDPGSIIPEGDVRYLIIPKTSDAVRTDFINFRAPNAEYKTKKVWDIPDGTTIVKRIKIK